MDGVSFFPRRKRLNQKYPAIPNETAKSAAVIHAGNAELGSFEESASERFHADSENASPSIGNALSNGKTESDETTGETGTPDTAGTFEIFSGSGGFE